MKSHNDAGVSIIDDEDIKSSPLLHAVRTYSDSDDAVAFYRGSTRYEDAEEGFVHIWADLPDDVHERAQVMYDGSLLRYMRTGCREWSYTNGSMNGVEGKARLVAVKLTKNGRSRSYLMHRLVAYAYLARPPKESRRELVCHINPREVDSYPDNGFCNIYWGTTSDNAADEERAGRPKIGNRRYFRGRQCDSTEEDYEIFSSQTEAAIFVGEDVCQSMISRALRDYAKSVGKSRWKFEYCVMEFEDDEILADIDETTKFGRRFITNRGRTGEFKRVKKNGTFVDIPVEFFIGVDSNGYRLIGNIGGYSSQVRLHRLVFEKFAPEVIKSKEMNTGKMWNVPHDIDVDHINGDKLDNDINNLELLTRTEHSNKRTRVRPVVELDEQGRIIGEWPSVSSAASSTGTQPQTLHKVCLRTNGATRGGRRFAFREVALEGKEPSRKFKRSRFACE